MIQIKLIEKENLRCYQNHNFPICSIDVGKNVQMNERLLCSECMLNIRLNMKILGLNIIQSEIENNIKENLQKKISFISQKKNQLLKLYNFIDQWKSTFNSTIDSIIKELDYWMDSLIATEQINNTYNFIQELENYINQQTSHEKDLKLLIGQITNINKKSVNTMLLKFTKMNTDYRNFITQTKECLQEIIKIQQPKITLKLINNQLKQSDICYAISLNYTGQIMVSGYAKDIKVWNFQDGNIQEVQKLQGHNDNITCLLFSKQQNSFISGSSDNTIKCWKQINGQQWKISKSYEEHTDMIQCLLLCKNETTLFSGSADNSIKIWQVDFDNNDLRFSYSLIKHTSFVFGFSLNESETYFISCGGDNQIIIWSKTHENKWEFYQVVIIGKIQNYIQSLIYQIQQQYNLQLSYFNEYKQSIDELGVNICFIKENQFFWIGGIKNGQDCVSYFEQINGNFVEQKEKEQQLIVSSNVVNYNLFPIVFNKEKEIILLRHKFHVYLLIKQTNGIYRISKKNKFESNSIYGTMTTDAKFIILWEKSGQNYSIYQIEYEVI